MDSAGDQCTRPTHQPYEATQTIVPRRWDFSSKQSRIIANNSWCAPISTFCWGNNVVTLRYSVYPFVLSLSYNKKGSLIQLYIVNGSSKWKENGNGMALQCSLIWCTYWQDVCAFQNHYKSLLQKWKPFSDSTIVDVWLGLGTKLIWLGLVKHRGLDKRKTVIFWKSLMRRSIKLSYGGAVERRASRTHSPVALTDFKLKTPFQQNHTIQTLGNLPSKSLRTFMPEGARQ